MPDNNQSSIKDTNETKGCIFLFFSFFLPIILICLLAIGVISLFKGNWGAIAFYIYIGVGLVNMLVGGLISLSWLAQNRRYSFASTIFKGLPSDRLRVLRKTIYRLFDSLDGIATWPVGFFRGFITEIQTRKKESGLTNIVTQTSIANAHMVKKGTEHIKPTFALLVVGAIYISYFFLRPPYMYRKWFLVLMVVHIILKYLSYLSDTDSLPQKLRSSLGNPYIKFAIILVVDFIVICLSINAYTYWDGGEYFLPTNILKIVSEMMSFQKIRELQLSSLQPINILVIVVGFLYYTVIIENVLKFKEFVRKDEDYLSMATEHIFAKRYSNALENIKKVKIPNTQSAYAEMVAYIGVGEFEDAVSRLKTLRQLEQKGTSTTKLYELLLISSLQYKIPPRLILRLIGDAISHKIEDSHLAGVVQFGLVTKDLEEETVNKILELNGGIERYPLTIMAMLLLTKQYDKLIEFHAKSTLDGFDEYIGAFFLLFARMFREQKSDISKNIFETWCSDYLEPISSDLPRIMKRDDSEKSSMYEFLLKMTELAVLYKSDYEEQIRFLANKIKTSISEELSGLVQNSLNTIKDQSKYLSK